jgi:AAT family amino acid transporter
MVLFSYVGIEMIGLFVGEAENTCKTISMAIDSLAWRISIFCMGAILVILTFFPWNEVG